MYKDPTLHSMQLNVPHSVYGACTYFIPTVIREWLSSYGVIAYYCGGNSWGDGFTNGVANSDSTYMVYNIQPYDATAFKIHFPFIKVHTGKQYDYTETKTNT